MRIYISLTAASTEEILRGTFYNHNIHASTSEVGQMLKKVDLASHGYRREVTTKLVEGPSGSQRCSHNLELHTYVFIHAFSFMSHYHSLHQNHKNFIPRIFLTRDKCAQ